ncbi:hypothetical protein GCM10027566_39180 [Arachidicoccus ginsenosidivorans]|uniref:DNA methyltransferase n=1 Tax=Arachidicoccus ginsenosidivorans TaxID=496057 RepID=UPI001CEF58DA|nr:DNA methyltransferase [Arachidicoccus ginsenosidivorans]
MELNKIINAESLKYLKTLKNGIVDLIYFDPPFFTQKTHKLIGSDSQKTYQFDDKFESLEQYLALIKAILTQCRRVLKDTGSVFLHCDKTASHHIRQVLDVVFGPRNFQSEIVWAYKR